MNTRSTLRLILWEAIMNGTKSGSDERLRLLAALDLHPNLSKASIEKPREGIHVYEGELPPVIKPWADVSVKIERRQNIPEAPMAPPRATPVPEKAVPPVITLLHDVLDKLNILLNGGTK